MTRRAIRGNSLSLTDFERDQLRHLSSTIENYLGAEVPTPPHPPASVVRLTDPRSVCLSDVRILDDGTLLYSTQAPTERLIDLRFVSIHVVSPKRHECCKVTPRFNNIHVVLEKRVCGWV